MKVSNELLTIVKSIGTAVFAGNSGGKLVLVYDGSVGYTEIVPTSYERGATMEEADEFAMKLNTEALGYTEEEARKIILRSMFAGAQF